MNVKSLNSKLAVYSAMAGAAFLTAPSDADAQGTLQNITRFSYSGGDNFVITPPLVNDSGGMSFYAETQKLGQFKLHVQHSTTSGRAFIGGWIAVDSRFSASRLAFGDRVSGRQFHDGSGRYQLASRTYPGGASHGHFLPSGDNAAFTGYAAFEARPSAGHTYYGWLRVKVVNDSNGLPYEVTLVDKDSDGIYGAFASKNDPSIGLFTAGQIAPVPEPSVAAIGGLGLLALGAVGVREMRRRRKA